MTTREDRLAAFRHLKIEPLDGDLEWIETGVSSGGLLSGGTILAPGCAAIAELIAETRASERGRHASGALRDAVEAYLRTEGCEGILTSGQLAPNPSVCGARATRQRIWSGDSGGDVAHLYCDLHAPTRPPRSDERDAPYAEPETVTRMREALANTTTKKVWIVTWGCFRCESVEEEVWLRCPTDEEIASLKAAARRSGCGSGSAGYEEVEAKP